MSTIFRRIGIGAMLGVISLVLVACSDTPQPTATTAPVATATPALTTQATTAPANTSVPESVATSTPSTDSGSSDAATATATTASTSEEAEVTKLNLNEVTEAELMATIPNFPTRMVREFQEYRPYSSIQQFRQEIGKYVDQAQVTEWENYVYVPVVPNESDAETLMQLPGVDESIAATLASSRPYASNDAFLEALSKYVDATQVAQAKNYLAAE